MNTYEFVYIVDAHATQAVKDEITKQVNEALAKSNIKVINSQIWLDKSRLAFTLKKCQEATYGLINFQAARSAITNLRESLILNERILRYLIIDVEA